MQVPLRPAWLALAGVGTAWAAASRRRRRTDRIASWQQDAAPVLRGLKQLLGMDDGPIGWAPIAELDTLERYQVAQVMQGLGYALEDVMAYLGEPDLVAALQRAQDARAESASQMARAFMAGEGAASYGG